MIRAVVVLQEIHSMMFVHEMRKYIDILLCTNVTGDIFHCKPINDNFGLYRALIKPHQLSNFYTQCIHAYGTNVIRKFQRRLSKPKFVFDI